MLYDQSINQLLHSRGIGLKTCICGWVKTVRNSKEIAFLALNDGSSQKDVQIVVETSTSNFSEIMSRISTGASLQVKGEIKESNGKEQAIEILAEEIVVLGEAPSSYPLQKKRHGFEFLREIAHLRGRTNTFGAMNRVRSHVSHAIHTYFQEREFTYIHTPLITGSDAEGAGEMFRVTTAENGKAFEDGSGDFFGKKTYLTVSGQLAGETQCIGLGKIYTFGPTFRAENSNTVRHAAEFWMIEPEMAFYDLDDLIHFSEDFLKHLISSTLEHCADEIAFFNSWVHKGLLDELQTTLKSDFKRLRYTEAIELLLESKKTFEYPVEWGTDLASEHEKYLCEELFKRPVILTDYPAKIKAFYMKQGDDENTVRAMDILFPRLGEVIGGSQREDNLEILEKRIVEHGQDLEAYQWYLDLRRYGSVPHSGFGLGLERMVMFLTGLSNIRDVLTFPRTPNNCLF